MRRPTAAPRKVTQLCSVLCLVLFVAGGALSAVVVLQEAIVKAEKAIEAKDYTTALALLKEQTAKDPQNYRAWFDIAYAYTMMGERAQAIAAYRKTLEVRPQLTQASLNLGILLLEEKQAAEAAQHLAAVVTARPKDARAQLLYADALASSGDPAKAAEEYRRAIALDAKSYDARYALGRLLVDQKQFAEADQALAKAIELQPANAAARLEMARLWELTGRVEEARRFYSEVAQKEPGNAAVRRRLGALLLAKKQFVEAVAEFEAAARLGPLPPGQAERPVPTEDDWNLARAYAGAKRAEQAIPLLTKLAAADPRNYEARLLLGNMLAGRRDFAAAQKELETAVALRPDLPDAYVDLANALYLQQNFPGTLAVLNRVARLGPETPWLHFLRAITLDKLEQVEPALESYERFLAIAKGQYPDQEFQARQRVKALNLRLEKSGKRRRR